MSPSHQNLAHWDDVPFEEISREHLRGFRQRLGAAAGTSRAGLSRYHLRPGEHAIPVHRHGGEEEIFYVLAGTGLSWQDGRTYAVRAGDCIVHRPGGEAHTIVASDEPLDVLAFGDGVADTTWLPRAQAMWAGAHWLPFDGADPFALEDAAGPLDVPLPEDQRPPGIVHVYDVPDVPWGEGDVQTTARDLAPAAGARQSGLNITRVAPGALSAPPHCHSAEEEIFVVLGGAGSLLLGEDEVPVRRGHIVVRPPGTGVAHTVRAGDGGLVILGYGVHDPNDICFYPRSNKVALRGVKAVFRVERVDYWDGEE
jgi:uncharacterized cupin superfamily protein